MKYKHLFKFVLGFFLVARVLYTMAQLPLAEVDDAIMRLEAGGPVLCTGLTDPYVYPFVRYLAAPLPIEQIVSDCSGSAQ